MLFYFTQIEVAYVCFLISNESARTANINDSAKAQTTDGSNETAPKDNVVVQDPNRNYEKDKFDPQGYDDPLYI